MPDYQQGKIYSLRSHQTDDIYIGSTVETLSRRMAKHRCDYKRWKEGKWHNVTSYELLQYDDCYIELIEKCPCNSKEELHQREGELIREMDCVNRCIAGRTAKEWREANREKLEEYFKQLYRENKERLLEQRKQYRQDNKEKIAQYKKQYREANKKKIALRDKQYYEANKEKIAQRQKEKINCECGEVYTRVCKARHERTKKHQEYISNKIVDTVG